MGPADIKLRELLAKAPADLAAIEAVLAQGADPNLVDVDDFGFERTPLGMAAGHGDMDAVLLLMARGADGRRPEALTVAAERGDVQMCELLLDAGADPNGTRKWQDQSRTDVAESPVQAACEHGHGEVLQLLVERGARVDDCFRATFAWDGAVVWATGHGSDRLFDRVLDGGGFGAVFADDPDVAEVLRRICIIIDAAVMFGDPRRVETIIHMAVTRQPGWRPELWRHARVMAIHREQLAIARLAEAKGGELSTQMCGEGIEQALRRGKPRIAEAFHRLAGPDIDPHTWVWFATCSGKLDAVKWALDRGGDPWLRREGETPLDLAKRRGFDDIVALIAGIAGLTQIAPRLARGRAIEAGVVAAGVVLAVLAWLVWG